MLDRVTGQMVHIDFGDCFEVAMQREKFPEKIPFRLTRMLVNAMEVSGIEGTFRRTCEKAMAVLRDSRSSLMALLEAFIHDPLIGWRLVAEGGADGAGGGSDSGGGLPLMSSHAPSAEAAAMLFSISVVANSSGL